MYKRADKCDLVWLNDVLLESELYWQENRAFEAQLRATFRLSEPIWRRNKIFIVSKADLNVGFFGLEGSHLNYLYLQKNFIAKGYGRYLWQEMIACCKMLGIKRITFECSDSLSGFYEHMGATYLEMVPSSFGQNRMISKYGYDIVPQRVD